jgi:hypothetical protein
MAKSQISQPLQRGNASIRSGVNEYWSLRLPPRQETGGSFGQQKNSPAKMLEPKMANEFQYQ